MSWKQSVAGYLPDFIAQGPSWPVNVLLFKQRGQGGVAMTTDKARRLEEDSGSVYQLKAAGTKTRPVDLGNVYRADDTGEDWVFLYTPDNEEYIPLGPSIDQEILEAADVDWDRWSHLSSKQARMDWETEKKWWKDPQNQMMMVAGMGMFLVIIAVGWSVAKVMGSFNESAQVLADTMNAVKPLLEQAIRQSGGG